MAGTAPKPLRIFCSYSHRDEEHLNDLRDWLRGLERQGLIEWWHDREITPGWEWEETIDKNLRSAEIILLLVTPDFMASDYVYEKEIVRAIERHERGEARVIPIIVRPALWKGTPLGRLQALPKDAKPITTWPDRDEAWLNVAEGIQEAVAKLLVEHQQRAAKEQYRQEVEAAWADNTVSAAEAERLSVLASELGLSVDTAADIEREVVGDTKEATLERRQQAARGNEEIERRKRLDERYAEARRLHHTRKWQRVIDVFEQIRAEDPAYPDREELLASAREELEAQERERKVAAVYDRGQRHIKAKEWQQALECFEEIQRLEPNYRETETLLAQVRQRESADHAEKMEASERQRQQAGHSTYQTERVQPERSADTQPQLPLPMLARNWWALALAGLIMVILGLFVSLTRVESDPEGPLVRLLSGSLVIVSGVFIIIASSAAHPRLLLRTQGVISVLAGVVVLLSGAWGDSPFSLYYYSFDFWGLCLGLVQIIAAIRLGWEFKVMPLMVVSGALLVVYGLYSTYITTVCILGGYSGSGACESPTLWLLGVLLLASGASLVAFAFGVRRWEGREVGA